MQKSRDTSRQPAKEILVPRYILNPNGGDVVVWRPLDLGPPPADGERDEERECVEDLLASVAKLAAELAGDD